MKRWKCSVCGYVHTGDKPPEKCPVCGAPASKFVEITDNAQPVAQPQTQAAPVAAASTNILASPAFTSGAVNKVANVAGNDITADTYYFEPGQVLAYHRHPKGEQIFFILQGHGQFYLDDGSEKVIEATEGTVILVPTGVWHKLVNSQESRMIAAQATKAGAGMEARL